MRILLLFTLFLFLIVNSNSTRCIHSDKSQTFENESFRLDRIKDTVYMLQTAKVSKRTKCKIEIKIFYKTRRIKVEFGNNVKFNRSANAHIHLMTSVIINKDIIETVNILRFVCDDRNGCEQHFFLDYIDWIFSASYDKLATTISPFLVDDGDKGKDCFIEVFFQKLRTTNCLTSTEI